MIRRTTFFAFFLLSLFTGGILFQSLYSSKEKGSIEETLTQEISHLTQEEKCSNTQVRIGVSKDLWISDHEKGRLHHYIESPQSILTAIPNGTRMELVEQLSGMECYFQEKIEENEGALVQNVRYIQSDEGIYHYNNHHFDAGAVFLALYQLPGNTLSTRLDPSKAYLKGIAEEVSLSFAEGSPTFHANKFKAQVKTEELSK